MPILRWACDLVGIHTPIILGSILSARGHSSELIINMLKETGATRYLAGQGAQDYDVVSLYQAADITYERQAFQHVTYPQLKQQEFIPGLSILDAFFNLGAAETRSLLATGHAST